MATENAKVLWIVVLLTSIGLIIGMTLWLTRPLRRKILEISNRLTGAGQAHAYEWPPGGHDEASGGEGEVLVEPLAPDLAEEAGLLRADFLEIRNIKNELEQLERTVNVMVNACHGIFEQYLALQEQERSVTAVCAKLENSGVAIRQLVNHHREALSAEQQSSLDEILQENERLIKEYRQIVRNTEEVLS